MNDEYEFGSAKTGDDDRDDDKPENFKEAWIKLLRYSKAYFPVLIIAVICSAASSILTLIGPDKLRELTNLVTDGLLSGIDLAAVGTIAVSLIVLYSVGAVLSFAQGITMTVVSQKLSKNLRTSISKKINRLPLKYYDSNSYGDILSRVTNDTDTLGNSLNQSIGQLVHAAAMFIGSIIMMFKTNPQMAVTAVASTILGFGVMILIVSRTQKYFKQNQDNLGDINGHIEEIYAGHNIVKAYNGERGAKQTFDEINDRLYESNWKSQFLSGLMMPLMGFIGNFGYVAVCVVGAYLVMHSVITFGVIVAFMIYIRLFTQPLSQMAQSFTSMQSTAAAAERVFEFIDEADMPPERETLTAVDCAKIRGDVSFNNVVFGYSEDKTVINDFSANVKAGQKVAIVGPTGAGKTTMVNLLMRFYEIGSGEITIDGTSISQISRENVHDMFCMVLQDTWLFEGTIRENIVYSKRDVSDASIDAACNAVGLDHYIRSLPKGYDTILGDNANISAGQRQLLTIARAMIQNSPLLILDEATSSVDTRTELLVQNAMDALTVGRTSFVIAHRLSTVRNADLILVMRDGGITEQGTHVELLSRGGFYAELYNSQFEDS
ncbi:MAG: ABC transporter ATP-binding protein/permease [Oscillospiraceae bacterium]|jgi:ATP-binding cassette subfamily B protein|nr:ABC transporter ATP-binding protein/permease [Oscillospiraceae bacterium]